ncbi:MAG: universal stress protein [Chitinophagaceae bacterium]|nr:universal stress protein [Chitinophagaceae bacterium]
MKKVLIALDYNPTAQQVAETGYSLAKAMNAEVILFHVVADAVYYSSAQYSPIMGYTGTGMDIIQDIDETGLIEEAEKFLTNSKNHLADPLIKIMVAKGDCAENILKAAAELKAEIIVLGSHSRRWLEKVLMGSITEKVLHHTTIPLFIIPTGDKN